VVGSGRVNAAARGFWIRIILFLLFQLRARAPFMLRDRESPLHALDDTQLLHAFSQGREQAFVVLVERYGEAIKGYAVRMLHSPQQAEEVYVETFLRIAKGKGSWEARGTVRGFLFTIAHRLCLDILRQRKVTRDAVPHLVEMAEARPPSPSPEAEAVLHEQAAVLERCLSRLPVDHRQALLMRVVHGLSAAETAEALGLDEDQVNSQVSYARKRLRQWMEEEPEAMSGRRRREEA
jgi:RNA polymerase sigma-70 factor (ECF subfamily)